ncbi:MAG: poly-gamma-glutamate system protein [bacterium]|nr:poly-gamma-glutamate system protein [bacterium]
MSIQSFHRFLSLLIGLVWATLALAREPNVLYSPEQLQLRMKAAAEEMSDALRLSRAAHIRRVGTIDSDIDPNYTGLIGPDDTPIVSTLGQLSAKRTACVPDFAALITRWLYEAGVQPGDRIAIIMTGSFPGFNIASICAARAIEAVPVVQLSLGASEWGMTEPNFTMLDLYEELRQKIHGWPELELVTYGGGGDRALGMSPGGKKALDRAMQRNFQKPLVTKSLHAQIQQRIALLDEAGPYRAIIFIGGNIAALGTEETKEVGAGLLPRDTKLNHKKQSMMGEYLHRGTPVIYLHWTEHLAYKWDIPFDPEPLPEPGSIRKIYAIQ